MAPQTMKLQCLTFFAARLYALRSECTSCFCAAHRETFRRTRHAHLPSSVRFLDVPFPRQMKLRIMRRFLMLRFSQLLCFTLLPLFTAGAVGRADDGGSAAGNALRVMFNPTAATDVNTMGLIQRSNFTDRVAGQSGELQIALVVDGTESMSEQLDGVREHLNSMLADLQRLIGENVYVQIVVYRDVRAPSGTVDWPLGTKSFTADIERVRNALNTTSPETGAPYFLEAVDRGIHDAIAEIEWSQSPTTSRWIVVIGDAPPFERGFNDVEFGSKRTHSNEQLVQLARQKNIEIHSILCPTRQVDQSVYEQVVDDAREFFGDLSDQTGGLMLDLSDPNLLAQVNQAAEKITSNFLPIEPITESDIATLRNQISKARVELDPNKRIRVAVLPHVEISKMKFQTKRNDAEALAFEMSRQLSNASQQIEALSMSTVKSAFRELSLDGLGRVAALQAIGTRADANYVVWGRATLSSDGRMIDVQSSVMETATGKVLFETGKLDASGQTFDQVSSEILSDLALKSESGRNPPQFASVRRGGFRTTMVSTSSDINQLLVQAREEISNSLQFSPGQSESVEKLQRAVEDLKTILNSEPNNPIAAWLLANAQFNQSLLALEEDDPDGASSYFSRAIENTNTAVENSSMVSDALRLEIEADHNFLLEEYDRAAEAYRKLAERGDSVDQVRRAHWMLAGIHSGDWGIANVERHKELVDAEKAREHILTILALFEDSNEAKFFRKNLIYDPNHRQTLNSNVPLVNPTRASD